MQELKKGLKVVHEFSLFLVHEGYTAINIDLFHENEKYSYVIKTNRIDDKLYEFINEIIDVGREFDLEEYTWELMGEGDGEESLYSIGSFLDEFLVERTDNETIFRMVRYVRR